MTRPDGVGLARPQPLLEGLAGEFYDWCRRGELRFQRCTGCGVWRHVPRVLCAACGGADWEWARSRGRGEVFSWTVVNRAMHPAFTDAPVFAPAVIAMEEGVRILSRVVDRAPDALEIGLPVEVAFEPAGVAHEPAGEEVVLPVFRAATAGAGVEGDAR